MSPGHVIPGPEASLLLSPSAFQQSMNKTTTAAAPVVSPPSSEPSSASGGAAEPLPTPCSKIQLQETLIHLIKVHLYSQINTRFSVLVSLVYLLVLCQIKSILYPENENAYD